MLICVAGEASGVFGCGEIVSLPVDAEALAGMASAATATPVIRCLLSARIGAEGYAPPSDSPTPVLR
jgi:hypothetical protein